MRVVVAENVVDHIFFRDVIGPHNDEVLNVIAAQQLSGGTVCDTAEHFAQLLQRYDVGIIPIDLIKALYGNHVQLQGRFKNDPL